MPFDSQRDFNRYMDGYMDRLAKSKIEPKGFLFAKKPKPAQARIDKAVALEDKELEEVVVPKREKEKKRSLLEKLMFFAGDASKQEKEAKKALGKDLDDEELDEDIKLDDVQPRHQVSQQWPTQPIKSAPFYPRPQQQPQPARVPQGAISNGVPLSSLRIPASSSSQRQPEMGGVEQNFPYSPNQEKDIKYLVGLINTLINRLEPARKQEFYRSSEYRIFESVRKKY